MISVVVPLYNKESYIPRALASVMRQTYRDYEIVVVDDGSTDNGVQVVEGLQISCLRLIRQDNAGVAAARNRGIREAKGNLIAFLDADDEWKPDYLETQMRLVERYSQCDVFATNYEINDERGVTTPTIIRKLPFEGNDGELTNYFEVACCSHPPLWTSAVMVRKTAILLVGGFPVGIKSGEDLLTWARLAAKYEIAYSKKVGAVFVYDEKLFNTDQRDRLPESEDYVGKELKQIYSDNKKVKGLKQYVALWHKMRARIYIQKHKRCKGLAECVKSMRYSVNMKIVIFFLLACSPYCISDFAFRKLG